MTTITLAIRPSDDPHPQAHTDNGEDIFMALLTRLGYEFEIEPDTLEIEEYRPGVTAKGVTPDVKLLALPDGRTVGGLYIELTIADHFLAASQLPAHVLIKNFLESDSGEDFIASRDYLQRKQLKIDAALRHHDVDIILLDSVAQANIIATPSQLAVVLAPYIPAAIIRSAAYAAF